MDVNNNTLAYSIGSHIYLFNISNILSITQIKSVTFSTPIDEMMIYLPYLFIISNKYLWQFDFDVEKSINYIGLVNATNEANPQNFMMKWFFGD